MQFVFQPLTWGFLLMLVPIIAHLINVLRHRRVKWAAIDFLRESYRKNRRWVWMKQFLLLLSRIAIMGLLVLLLAQWITGAHWLSMFGQTITHHYVLLDDSSSMGDTVQGKSAYDTALGALASMLRSVGDDRGTHQVTILRYSRALSQTPASSDSTLTATSKTSSVPPAPIDAVADVLARTVTSDSDALLAPLNRTRPVALSLSPIAALQAVAQLVQATPQERAVVYLFSDFRDIDWRQSADIRGALEPLRASNAEIQLIDCVDASHENISLVSLQPDQEVLAANVPLMMRVEIRNTGSLPAKNINLSIRTFEIEPDQTQPRIDRFASGKESTLPSVMIDMIPPNETVSRRFQAIFSNPGSHAIQATIPDDVLNSDNSIAAALDVVDGQSLLVIDGDDSRRSAFYLNATLNPGGLTRTGWKPTTESPSFLRDTSVETLNRFAVVVLLNTFNLDPRAIANLEAYVASGGGLTVAVGGSLTAADIDRINRDWYRRGEGFMPVEIEGIATLPEKSEGETGPDMLATSHPIFGPLLGQSNSPFQFVRVFRFVRPKAIAPVGLGTTAPNQPSRSTWQSILQLRDGSPMMIDYPFGLGRVIVLNLALDPDWSTWPQDPTFVVGMLKTMGYLASFRQPRVESIVGTPIRLDFSSRDSLPEVEVVLPAPSRGVTRPIMTKVGVPSEEPNLTLEVAADTNEQTEEQLQAMLSPGITELWQTSLEGKKIVRCYSRSAPASEGELKKSTPGNLITSLRPVEVKVRMAETLGATTALAGLTNRQGLLLALLIGLLLFEQVLAWSASYHLPQPKKSGVAA